MKMLTFATIYSTCVFCTFLN